MPVPTKILVIDHNRDSAALLTRTLLRKFPQSSVEECQDASRALAALARGNVDAVVLHRTEEMDAVAFIKTIRAIAPTAPIIAVSGIDRSEDVLAAGATGFLNYAEWLRIGTVVANVLGAESRAG